MAKTKLNSLDGLAYRSWIDSYIEQNDFLLTGFVLGEYHYMKEENENLKIWKFMTWKVNRIFLII